MNIIRLPFKETVCLYDGNKDNLLPDGIHKWILEDASLDKHDVYISITCYNCGQSCDISGRIEVWIIKD